MIGILAFFLVPTLGQAHFGLSQRLLIGSFRTWMLTASTHQLRASSSETPAVGPLAPARAG